MFTVEQREELRARLLRLAQADARVVAGAAVGSLALGGGDRFSDLDLTFAIADHVPLADVLTDWTRTLRDERGGAHGRPGARSDHLPRVPAPRGAAVRPVHDDSGAVSSRRSRFRLLFRQTAAGEAAGPPPAGAGTLGLPTPVVVEDLFG